MTRGEFDRLTDRYLAGQCSAEEIAFIERWIEVNGQIDEDRTPFDTISESELFESEMWENIQTAAGFGVAGKRRKFRAWVNGGIAASIALIVIFYLFSIEPARQNYQPLRNGVETHNLSEKNQRISLPDSSFVTLASGASLIKSDEYGIGTRSVWLTGEAFFEVRRNPALPFLVFSGDLVTEVLGTSFTIKPQTGKKTIEVAVVSGKVSVYSNEKDRNQRRSGVIIRSNQKVLYDTEMKTIKQDLVDIPKIVIPVKPNFDFDETSVREVLATLRQAYETEIVTSNPELDNCRFTGNLEGFDLFKQLEYLCNIINAEYEVRGTTIFLTGSGCSQLK